MAVKASRSARERNHRVAFDHHIFASLALPGTIALTQVSKCQPILALRIVMPFTRGTIAAG
jgi:hypothetical protein